MLPAEWSSSQCWFNAYGSMSDMTEPFSAGDREGRDFLLVLAPALVAMVANALFFPSEDGRFIDPQWWLGCAVLVSICWAVVVYGRWRR